jgi:SAM-dependent methyltransferase
MDKTLVRHKSVWSGKETLRKIYIGWYQKITADLAPGKTLELGSGNGNYKDFNKRVITSDVDRHPGLDMKVDAHRIPFENATLTNIVMIDVLHHLHNPAVFLREAQRVLKPGGRLIMLEPYPSPVSRMIYGRFHPEPFDFKSDPFRDRRGLKSDPWEANQAIPYRLFFQSRKRLEKEFPKFKVEKAEKLSFLAYPLSGGFDHPQLLPDAVFPLLMRLEKYLKPLAFLTAFRCYIVLVKIK